MGRSYSFFALFSALALTLASASAAAQSIDFDDRSAYNGQTIVSDEYAASLGVHFVTTDDVSTWSGMSGGDPGGWHLEGPARPSFLGATGRSAVFVIQFDAPVNDFQLSLARGDGSPTNFFDTVTAYGMRGTAVVDSRATYLGDVNQWTTLALSGEVDRIIVRAVGFYVGFRFGIDDLRWQGATPAPPQDHPVAIDIHPGSARNPIRVGSHGVVPVLLLGADDCDVADIDAGSLRFGPGNASLAHADGPHVADHNGDGRPDLMLHFRVDESGIGASDEVACVHGSMNGMPLEGCDKVSPIGER